MKKFHWDYEMENVAQKRKADLIKKVGNGEKLSEQEKRLVIFLMKN